MSKLIYNIGSWLYWVDWMGLFFWVLVLAAIMCCVMFVIIVKDTSPRTEQNKL